MRLIAPMLAIPGEPPENTDDWAAEMKYDGFRLLAAVGGGERPVLWTRNLNVVTSSYPEVVAVLSEKFGGRGRIVFDGEIVALAQGRPSFARLQKRANALRPTTALRRQVPVTYLPFDVLAADGEDLMAAPYLERRAALSDLGHELHGAGLPVQFLPHWIGVDGPVILDAARNSMMEGAIFKRVPRFTCPVSAPGRGGKCCCAAEVLPLWSAGSRVAVFSATWSALSSSAPTTTTRFSAMWVRCRPDSPWRCATSSGRSWPSSNAVPVRSEQSPRSRPHRSTGSCARSIRWTSRIANIFRAGFGIPVSKGSEEIWIRGRSPGTCCDGAYPIKGSRCRLPR